jgi:hypothetical protein
MRGYSLLECVCSICIIGILSALVLRATHHASATLGAFTQNLEERNSMTKAALVVSAILSASERSHMEALISIRDGGLLTLPHGGAHPVQGVGSTSRPRALSHIVSAIEVDPRLRGRIRTSEFDATGIMVEVCETPSLPDRESTKSHLLIGVAGLCQVTGVAEPGTLGCFRLRGTPLRGLLLPQSSCPIASLHEYLPVSREASIFIDTTGELRLVSHVGMRVTENQPITRGLRSLVVAMNHAAPGAVFFDISLRARADKIHRFLLPAALTRAPIWNEILL